MLYYTAIALLHQVAFGTELLVFWRSLTHSDSSTMPYRATGYISARPV